MTTARGAHHITIGAIVPAIVLLLSACGGTRDQAGQADQHPAQHDGATPTGAMDMRPGEVRIDPRRQQLIGVTTATVERRPVEQAVRTVGIVAYDESRLADVTLKFHGWIERLLVDETGALVKKGQILFSLYSPELITTQEEYLTAFDQAQRLEGSGHPKAIENARHLLDAARQRLAYWDIQPVHLRALETERKVVRALDIHSPANGYVIEKNVRAGSHVGAGQLLYKLADLDQVWILADIYEYELPLVHTGQEAHVSLAYLPGETFTGTLSYIYPYLDAKERTVKVRIRLPNAGHKLREGMYADVVLRAERPPVLAVPRAAVLDTGKRQVVFLAREEGRFEPREVTLGGLYGDYREVLTGLAEGDRVVSPASFLLDSESQLASGMRQMQH